jgi:hypothetical protein
MRLRKTGEQHRETGTTLPQMKTQTSFTDNIPPAIAMRRPTTPNAMLKVRAEKRKERER